MAEIIPLRIQVELERHAKRYPGRFVEVFADHYYRLDKATGALFHRRSSKHRWYRAEPYRSIVSKIIAFKDLHRLGSGCYVMASGTFDLLHIGHVYYLQEAATYGRLVVCVTEGKHVTNRGPGRPVFTDRERVDMLSALECVMWVCLVPYPTMVEAIRELRPALYVKGAETRRRENPDMDREKEEVAKHGGRTEFIGITNRYSSGALLSGEYLRRRVEVKPA